MITDNEALNEIVKLLRTMIKIQIGAVDNAEIPAIKTDISKVI